MKLRILFAFLASLALTACQEKEYPVDVPVYSDVDNLVIIDTTKTHIGGEYTVKSIDNFTYGIKGMEYGDEVKLRYQPTGELMSWKWGYKYLGILTGQETAEDSARLLISNGRKYEPDTIVVGYSDSEYWKPGKWDLLVVRASESQVIGTFDCKALILKEENAVDTSQINVGNLTIFADGWVIDSDSLLFFDMETKECAYRYKPSLVGITSENGLLVQDLRDSLGVTGRYQVQVKRWANEMKQNIFSFDFFYYDYADPAFTYDKSNDEWFINVLLTEDLITSSTRLKIAYAKGSGFNYNIEEENYNKETHVYSIPIPAAGVEDNDGFTVSLDRPVKLNFGEISFNADDFK